MAIITVAASAASVGASMATMVVLPIGEAMAVSATDVSSASCATVEWSAKTMTKAQFRVVFYYFSVHYVNKVRYITEISLETCNSARCMRCSI